ncbi:MAG: LysR family transcriptional regulator, partial [Myxococcales bacterium]
MTTPISELFSGVVPFTAVAEERSFRRAAARLGVSAAAVSKAVSRLEASLGVTLFDRSSRHVALTPEGTVFLERCRAALANLQQGREQVADAGALEGGVLRVSLSPILARTLTPVLASFAASHPQLTFVLGVTDRYARLAEEQIDVAIRVGELEDSSLLSRVLVLPRWVTVASPAYLRARGTLRTPAELAG